MKPSELHSEAVKVVGEKLASHAATKPFFAASVNVESAYPHVVISKGKCWANDDERPTNGPKKMRQVDVRVLIRTDDESQMPTLCVAVQTAIQTLKGIGPVSHCVLTDTGKIEENEGVFERRDLFACFG